MHTICTPRTGSMHTICTPRTGSMHTTCTMWHALHAPCTTHHAHALDLILCCPVLATPTATEETDAGIRAVWDLVLKTPRAAVWDLVLRTPQLTQQIPIIWILAAPYVAGNGGWADRLRHLLLSGAVVLKQETGVGEWWEPLLKPWRHFVPVSSTLHNLSAAVSWVRRSREGATHRPHDTTDPTLHTDPILYMYTTESHTTHRDPTPHSTSQHSTAPNNTQAPLHNSPWHLI